MIPVVINGKKYYYSVEIFEIAPVFFRKCKISGTWRQREVMKNKLVGYDGYKYFRQDARTKQWIPSGGSSNKVDKVFFSEEYLLRVPELTAELKGISLHDYVVGLQLELALAKIDVKLEARRNDIEIADKNIELADKDVEIVTLKGQVECMKLHIEIANLKFENTMIKQRRNRV